MFSKILIANRGEIACRIVRTARRMGIASVAVYSTADKDAPHVQEADEAVLIGGPSVAESYLCAERILAACRQTGAQAVHPGYGFLSENARFAQQLAEAGIVFIGPPHDAIAQMGDKIASKRLAAAAGVSTIPGYDDAVVDAIQAVALAHEIGYPVMLKASAGGGGKGMRIARDDDECRSGYARASSEANTAFGDGRLLIEKYIENPRHVEIQVLADAHGNVLHLGERECSLQRRHQKVIEESPSPLLDDATRQEMGGQAVALAKAVGYQSAGTVEFVADPQRRFYFLEMNTRLQVEHPVTEATLGLDLVEWMIRIAAGEPLTLQQSQIAARCWAIEARVYAEDPYRGFLPSIGRLVRFQPPAETSHVRIDAGVEEGGEISMHYDPMIAKVIVSGADRLAAIDQMRDALNAFVIRGVAHNLSFLAALIEHPRFRSGNLSTNLIAEEYPDGFQPESAVHDQPWLIIAVAATIHRRYMERAAQISDQLPGFQRIAPNAWVVVWNGVSHPVEVHVDAERPPCYSVLYDQKTYRVVSDWQFGQPLFRGTINEQPICLQVERRNLEYRLFHWGSQIDVTVVTQRAAQLLASMPPKAVPDLSRYVLSPMPGLLTALTVGPGDSVTRGQDLAVMEAMKMENVLRAERDGIVSQLLAGVGDTLTVDQRILEFE